MRFLDILKLSLRMFKARTMRTLLTVFGMSIGIAAILFLVSFGYGLQRTLLERITTADALVTIDVSPLDSSSPKFDSSLLEKMRAIPGVSDAVPAVSFSGQGTFESVTLDLETVAGSPSFLKLSGKKPLSGTFFDDSETDSDKVVITSAIANVFNVEPSQMIGRSFDIKTFRQTETKNEARKEGFFKTYTVVGIVDDARTAAFVPLSSADPSAYSRFTQLKIKCASTAAMSSVREAVLNLRLAASSISETVDQANKVFRIIQIVLMFFGVIALVVSAIGMFNTMTIALLERTEEIGIMKSIGASKTSLALLFIVEATLMGFLGGLFGVVFGLLAGYSANTVINLVATRFGGQSVTLFYSPLWFILAIVVFGALVGLLTGVFPARKATRIDPLDALRYK